MKIEKEFTLCENCDDCQFYDKEHIIKHRDGKQTTVIFKYCNFMSDIFDDINVSKGDDGYAQLTQKYIIKKYGTYHINRIIKDKLKLDKPIHELDHINHDKMDNRLINLRYITWHENKQNQKLFKKTPNSYYPGVTKNKKSGLWQAKYWVDNKQYTTSTNFKTQEAAYESYMEKMNELGRKINTQTISHQHYLNNKKGWHTLIKSFDLKIGHSLKDHFPCGILHGHTMKAELVITGQFLPENNFLIDFYDIKEFIKYIFPTDHIYLNELLEDDTPTTEKFVTWIYKRFSHAIDCKDYFVKEVRLWESDSSCIIYPTAACNKFEDD
jgi:6-pyruvoyltetrahydropterin/6-carboxytetrahydropterin synthase